MESRINGKKALLKAPWPTTQIKSHERNPRGRNLRNGFPNGDRRKKAEHEPSVEK